LDRATDCLGALQAQGFCHSRIIGHTSGASSLETVDQPTIRLVSGMD
jgi:hypothetical protein